MREQKKEVCICGHNHKWDNIDKHKHRECPFCDCKKFVARKEEGKIQ
jgi:hypothetical protein